MKVSIIITCYNYGDYLKEALQSALDLDFNKDLYEVIIVDDGSTDPITQYTVNKIKEQNLKNVVVIKKENGGVSSARNVGLEAAKGDYVLFLDADDKLNNKYLKETTKILDNKHGSSFVYTSSIFFNEKKKIKVFNLKYNFYSLLFRNYIPVTSLIRREDFVSIGGYKKCSYEDWEMYINLGKNGFKGFYLKKYLFLYRVHEDSKQHTDDVKKQKNIEEIRNIHKDLYNAESLRKIKKECYENELNFIGSEIYRILRAGWLKVRR